ncbi:unnamed protein product [Polarella glacialis]|uniref:Uncharacterized protein n=1 Tax=Polarella glacialis TaxID=89957 RepID=A0A813F934_POLGL|nr:unnamed protein product [Polarella glacialis]CAE8713569.1 unnamed protein product [Polarella glacialis]
MSHECKFCQRWQPLTAFSGNHQRRVHKGQAACCAECERALAALRCQAHLARSWSEGADCSESSTLEGGPTHENLRFWEQGIHTLLNVDYDCIFSDSWLPGMLRRWLERELGRNARALVGTEEVLHVEPLPAWLNTVRAERILQYDTATFPFEHIFRALFETADLAALHRQTLREDRPPLCPSLFRAYVSAGIKRPGAWKQGTRWETRYVKQFRKSGPYHCFMELYHRFIKQVVVPLLGCGELLYQCPPTLRCQMPSVVPSCSPHRDSDYAAHHGAEINFWIPVTKAWGSNSLHVESEPGKQDFHPLELGSGEMAIFNGCQCLHYTEANSTDSVRVSFDFRVIPKSLLDNSRQRLASKRHDTPGAATYQYEFLSTESLHMPEAAG